MRLFNSFAVLSQTFMSTPETCIFPQAIADVIICFPWVNNGTIPSHPKCES